MSTAHTEMRNVTLRLESRFDKMQNTIERKADRIMERLNEKPGVGTSRGTRRSTLKH